MNYHRAVQLRHLRQAMAYGQADFERDWDAAIALSQLLAVEETEERHRLLEETMLRVIAYRANNEYALLEAGK